MCLSIYHVGGSARRVPDCFQGGGEYLGDSYSQVTSHEEFPPLQLCLQYNEGKVGLGIHVARHVFDLFNLRLDAVVDSFEEPVGRPAALSRRVRGVQSPDQCMGKAFARHLCRCWTYSNSSGAERSATHRRVRACRSRVPEGMESVAGSTSRRMSSISIVAMRLGRV